MQDTFIAGTRQLVVGGPRGLRASVKVTVPITRTGRFQASLLMTEVETQARPNQRTRRRRARRPVEASLPPQERARCALDREVEQTRRIEEGRVRRTADRQARCISATKRAPRIGEEERVRQIEEEEQARRIEEGERARRIEEEELARSIEEEKRVRRVAMPAYDPAEPGLMRAGVWNLLEIRRGWEEPATHVVVDRYQAGPCRFHAEFRFISEPRNVFSPRNICCRDLLPKASSSHTTQVLDCLNTPACPRALRVPPTDPLPSPSELATIVPPSSRSPCVAVQGESTTATRGSGDDLLLLCADHTSETSSPSLLGSP